ncbi:helix-turn-helix domain-containing protein [Megasphaera elsdenii]|uniref:LexA family protein n=1 Tax=Megasphaera elsdenii TaxID=907 RepID=UPI00195975A2|nr:XRE family transcriptional regulator [Megasphaera elsdenii]MBM6701732.1 helix-turn-helix domain-containing protein [Megasphaera elsdenii]
MKSIGERIKEARKSAGLTQLELAKKTELSRSYIGDIEKDRYNPSVSTLQLIATATNTPLEDLLPSTKTVSPAGRGVRIPVLGRVVAGIPIEAVEEILDYEEITPELAATGEFFALQVKGDSMLPKLEEGDVVIVKKQADVETGDIAIVLVNGDEATIKQVKKVNGGIMLYGFNPDVYEPHFYSNQQIEELPVRILGKVIESRRSW